MADGGIMGGMRKQLHTKRDAERNARVSAACSSATKRFDT